MLQKPTTTPTRVGSLTSRTHGHTRISPLDEKPSTKNTTGSHAIGGSSDGATSGSQPAAQSTLNARNGGRRAPSQRSEILPTNGAPTMTPTAIHAMSAAASTPGRPRTLVRYETTHKPWSPMTVEYSPQPAKTR